MSVLNIFQQEFTFGILKKMEGTGGNKIRSASNLI